MSDSNNPGSQTPISHTEASGIEKPGCIKESVKSRYSFKNLALILMLIVIGVCIFSIYKINEIRTRAYIVYYGNEEVGIVRDKGEAEKILEQLQAELCSIHNSNIVLKDTLKFDDTHVKDNMLTSLEELQSNIKSKLTYNVKGYVLVVDGEELGYSNSKEELENILERLKEPYLNEEESQILDIGFVEDVKIVEKEFPLNKIKDGEEILEYILTGSEEIRTHTVEVGESLWTIAKIYDVSVDDLILANSDKDPERLQIGDEIKLTIPKPLITVEIVEEVEYTASVDFEVKTEYDDSMYKTQSKVKVKGQKGETKYLSKVIKHNGIVVDKEILKEEVIKEPVDQIVVQGTKELPKTAATGTFLLPTRGRLSSRYGMRGGRMHYGIDIAAPAGTAIKAADGGKVTYAGWKGSYGYLVEIDHENGYVTRYAHCSKIEVKVGSRVYKGQIIARVGSTGRSTGSHLHFEVLKNGVHVNPYGYVK